MGHAAIHIMGHERPFADRDVQAQPEIVRLAHFQSDQIAL